MQEKEKRCKCCKSRLHTSLKKYRVKKARWYAKKGNEDKIILTAAVRNRFVALVRDEY
jgi:hypothetical protein